MPESVYKVIELIGTSKDSWEKAAAAAVDRAGCRRQGRGLPRQAQDIVQIRGLTTRSRCALRSLSPQAARLSGEDHA
jgi:hypothetical protein